MRSGPDASNTQLGRSPSFCGGGGGAPMVVRARCHYSEVSAHHKQGARPPNTRRARTAHAPPWHNRPPTHTPLPRAHLLPRELLDGAIRARWRDHPHRRGRGSRHAQRVDGHQVQLALEVVAPRTVLKPQAGARRDGGLQHRLLHKAGVGHQAPHELARHLREVEGGEGEGRVSGACAVQLMHAVMRCTSSTAADSSV